MRSNLNSLLEKACNSVLNQVGTGKVANYIPALARINPKKFGASILTLDGESALYGDAKESFSIQSISKVFTLTLVLNQIGDELWKRVNHEPSGNTFNSIVQLEQEKGIPRNPFINAGAIVLSDILLEGNNPNFCISKILSFIQSLGNDESIRIDKEVSISEIETAHRNISLANFMKSFKNIKNEIKDIVEVYCNHCAISMSCEQLSRSFLYLAKEGKDPISGNQIINLKLAKRINSIMMLCGHYDASGDFAYRVGLPGKSGVGGGIVAVVPNIGVATVWSPGLNKNGNSLVGTSALEAITQIMGWNIL
ncbi:MAG: glutaminase [Leptospiraceae bacterium]|nr:glutaminase [Leptospiraceae bacterium]